MCGIFGITVNNKSGYNSGGIKLLIDELFVLSQVRGMESSGLVVKNHHLKSIGVLRKSVPGAKFINSKEYKNFLSKYTRDEVLVDGISVLGHTRIATNGMLTLDNQPIVKDNCYGIHNGIVCNIDNLWDVHKDLNRNQIIDTELLVGLIKKGLDENQGQNSCSVLRNVYEEIEGTASLGLIFNNYRALMIGTNCGSLFYYSDNNIFAFSSEEFILKSALAKIFIGYPDKIKEVRQLIPTSYAVIDESSLGFNLCTNENFIDPSLPKTDIDYSGKDESTDIPEPPFINAQPREYIESLLKYNKDKIGKMKRCTNCILPESHPFISFDDQGVCNYCRDYEQRKKRKPKGREALDKQLEEIRKIEGYNCIVMLSGGRDSCYALHVVKKELGLNPIAYSYDWGMLTDLGRRNQARMCAKLGVEHIIVSADIKKKREYIRLNVEAFLHKPHLGTIGLFMAGDKAYHHFAHELQERTGLPLINGGCPLEWTYFKEGFSGKKPSFMKRTWFDRFKILSFFMGQSLKNPKYLNASIFDNLLAFKYYYVETLKVINLFHFLPWNEDVVNNTLIEDYNWEVAKDSPTTWRIGDGTAAFYNYIYATVAGFTENDSFRSNQVLEGIITREDALKRAEAENQPRYESLKWYCDTIGVDLEKAIKTINNIPKLY
jgi:asparagine synthetase B (glutamine-hydrolysing)